MAVRRPDFRWEDLVSDGPELYRPPWRYGRGPIPRYLVRPTARFMRIEAAGGIVIVLAAVVAMVWANIDFNSYEDFWRTEITLDLDIHTLSGHLEEWVNDALMVIFFFVVGLEIKREMVHGDLASPRQAALPVLAAAGGMIVPALIFTAFNAGGDGSAGWGIPVATDIAFAVGVLTLLGNRIPFQLKIFLLTLAVADDIGGILIIAFFYSEDIAFDWLGAAFILFGVLIVMQRVGIRPIAAYVIVGLAIWLAAFESGVEATIAGVALGLITPAGVLYQRHDLAGSVRRRADQLAASHTIEDEQRAEDEHRYQLREIEELTREAQSPLERLEHMISPWSAFVVIPIFALANAGINLGGGVLSDAAGSNVAWGVAIGLVVGKLLGVFTFTYLAVRFGMAALPAGVTWFHVAGVSLLAGVGFTVAIFIAGLAYDDIAIIEDAKIGIFAASIIAAIAGYAVLRIAAARAPSIAPSPRIDD